MNYLKKSLIVFFPLLISLFLVKGYISTKSFSGTLKTILNSSGLNVEFDKVRLEKFNKLKIDNLKVKDMEGKFSNRCKGDYSQSESAHAVKTSQDRCLRSYCKS